MRPQPNYSHQGTINPITNAPLSYQQQQKKETPLFNQQYPQSLSNQGQFAQQPSQTNGFSNTYYNQTMPQQLQPQSQKPVHNNVVQVQKQEQLDAVEMDHMNGFSGRYPDTIHMHPTQQNTMIYVIAGLVVIEDLNQKHEQSFLRGHDMDVSALAVSRSGRFIASGQIGTRQAKVPESPVILWEYATRKPIQVLRGLRESVSNISFSEDEKFLAATCKLQMNEQIYQSIEQLDDNMELLRLFSCPYKGPRSPYWIKYKKQQNDLVTWCPPRKSSNKHSQYILVTSQGSNIVINLLDFDVASMQYNLKQAPCQLPSTGLVRSYTKALIDATGDYLYVGTSAGEMCIFTISTQGGIFKAAVPISNNGVQNMRISGRSLFVVNGDGKVKKLVGSDSRWALESEVQLEGRLTSIAVDPTGRELIVGSNFGKIFRLMTNSLDCTVHCEGHLQSVVGLDVSRVSNNIFVTIDMEGFVLVWDLNDLQVITRCSPSSMNRVRGCSVALDEDNTVVSGWKDGFIRAFTITNKPISPLKWEIVNAHKGGVTSIYADKNYYISAGEDGLVRVWTRSARQMVTQIGVHTRDVTRVFPDALKPHIIHTCSLDKTIHSYDLKADRKVVLHQAKNGMVMDMTQLKDRENELVTCGINTPLLFWDVDVVEPTQSIETGEKLNAIKISPDGKLLAAGSDLGELVLVSLTTDSVVGKYKGHSQGISKVAWTNDQKQIISTSFDGSLSIWNLYL